MEPALDALESAVKEIAPASPPPSVPLVSNITGRLMDQNERMDAAYWRRHAREPVAFRQCVETLGGIGRECRRGDRPPRRTRAGGFDDLARIGIGTAAPVVLHSLQRPAERCRRSRWSTPAAAL